MQVHDIRQSLDRLGLAAPFQPAPLTGYDGFSWGNRADVTGAR